jgi:sulfur-oxidizing protein SoxY
MSTIVIHAGGGCAGPVGGDEAAIRAAAGKIKLQLLPPIKTGQISAATFNIRHPMYTGLQRNRSTGRNEPAFFINRAEFSYNDKPVMQVDFGLGTAEDPYLRFFYLADTPGDLVVKAGDNEGHMYTHHEPIAPAP